MKKDSSGKGRSNSKEMELGEYIDAINRIPEKSPSVAETVSTKRHSSINRLKLQYQITQTEKDTGWGRFLMRERQTQMAIPGNMSV